MVRRVDLGLDREQPLRVPEVRLERERHLGDRLEQRRIDVPERTEHRILIVDDVVGDRPVVRVGHDLHAVADVVDVRRVELRGAPGRAVARAVGIAVARRVRIVDPVLLAVGDDEVRVGVVREERRDELLALADLAVEQDPRLARQLGRDEHVQVAEPDREQQAVPEPTHGDPAATGEARRGVVGLLRVVELVLARPDDDVVGRQLAVVDARLVDLRLAHRRYVLEHESRTALGPDRADRRHHRAEAVRVVEVLVHPGLRRHGERARRELAGRQHDRGLVAVDDVAIHVDVVERVVLAQGLELLVRREQRAVVPQAHARGVRELRTDVGLDGVVRDVDAGILDVRERVRRSRRVDVPGDVRPLLVQLIRRHHEPIDERRVHPEHEHRGDEPQADRADEHPNGPQERVRERGHRGHGHDDREELERREARVDARVAGPGEHVLVAEQQIELIEHVPERDEQEEQSAEDREVRARRPRERERVARRDADIGPGERLRGDANDAADDVQRDDADGDEDDRREQPPPHELEDRQGEEVEADVAAEDRIGRAERHAVQPAEERIPFVAAGEAEEERRDEQDRPEAQREGEGAGALADVGVHDETGHLRPEREVQVREGNEVERDEEDDERPEPGGVPAEEHGVEPEAAEPEQVGEESDERREDERDEEERDEDDREDRREPVRRTARSAAAAEPGQVDPRPVDIPPVAATGAIPHIAMLGPSGGTTGAARRRAPSTTTSASSAAQTPVTTASTGAARTSDGKSSARSTRRILVT